MNLLRLASSPGHLVGVRPEDVRFADGGLPVRVTSVEYLGADSIVACAAGAETLAVRVAGRVELAEGKHAHVACAPEAQHLFDLVTWSAILSHTRGIPTYLWTSA